MGHYIYDDYFKGYNVPENLKNTAIAIMIRFTITGKCDGMYLCNTIALHSGTGDGLGNFFSSKVYNIPEVAKFLQFAYGHNICKEDISELEDILRTGSFTRNKAIAGIQRYIDRCKQEKSTCDIFRVDYLDRCINAATMALAAI